MLHSNVRRKTFLNERLGLTIKGQKHRAVIKKREGTTCGERESETEIQSEKIK